MQTGGLIESFSIAITAIAIWGHLPTTAIDRFVPRTAMLGGVLGVGAVVSMLAPLEVAPGILYDFRVPLVAAAAYVGGPISALVALVLPLIYRLALGGVGLWSGCFALIASALIGMTCHLRRDRHRRRGSAAMALLVAAASVVAVLCLPRAAWPLALPRAAPMSGVIFGATWLFALSLLRDERHRLLRHRNEIYRAIIETLSHSLNAKDVHGRFTAANPATARLMGVASPAALLGRTDRDFYSPAMADIFAAQEAEVLCNVTVGPVEEEIKLVDGSTRWLASLKAPMVHDGTVIGIITHNQDITDRKRLEMRLEQAQRHFRAAVTDMHDGLLLLDGDGKVQFCNQQFCDLFPTVDPSGVVGAGLEDLVAFAPYDGAPDDHAAFVDQQAVALRQAGHRFIAWEAGRVVEARTKPVSDGETLIMFRDVTDTKRAEAAAREANRWMSLAEEIAHVGHWRFDEAVGTLTWSDEVFRIYGLEPAEKAPSLEEAIGFYHPDDRAEVTRCVAEAVQQAKDYEVTLRLVRRDGEIRNVLARGLCEVDAESGQVTGLFGVFVDITDLTKIQHELRQQSATLKTTLDNTDRGLAMVGPNGSIDLFNARFCMLLDVSREAVDEAPSFAALEASLQARGDVQRPAAQTDATRADGFIGLLETAHGRVLEVRVMPLPGGAKVMTYGDITERLKAEKAVQASEARYRMLADTTSDVVTQLNLDLTGRYVSPACRTMLGYEPHEMLALAPAAIIHPEDHPAVERLMRDLLAGSPIERRSLITYRIRHRDGHYVGVEAAITLVCDATGQPDSLLLALRDVTERHRVARHLERAKTAAENVARLKSEFVANMSHELRTPLTGIMGIHDLLALDQTLSPAQRRQVTMARDAGRSLLGIVNDVLDFSKIEAGQLTIERVPFDVADLFELCLGLVREQARPKSLTVQATRAGVPGRLVGDPARLQQVILNLATNAVKFTAGGTITIQGTYSESGRLRIAVIDTGLGIPQDKLGSLFDRFTQADTSITRRYGGTGLGLAISKHLVTLMGGEIGVSSQLGAGSTFWLEVPLAEHRDPVATDDRAMDGADATPLQILLAEDNAVNQAIITAMLEQRGHAVTSVDHGVEAVEMANTGRRFDVMLMDLQMPVMDGLTATRAIRRAEEVAGRAPVPIICLTANAMTEDVERCFASGMQAHVAKPIAWDDLFATITAVVAPCAAPAPVLAGAVERS